MSDRDIEVSIDVVSKRTDKKIRRGDLEDLLYNLLADQPDGSDAYEAIADTLALLVQIENIANGKGNMRDKGADVLRLLELSTAKDSLKRQRDQYACALIANESLAGNRPLSVIKDELAGLMQIDIAEVNRAWTAGKDLAMEQVSGKMSGQLVRDLKTAIADISTKIGNSTGK